MFRKMRRSPQALSQEEIIAVLINEKRGVLSVHGDDGYPYGVPLNHFYDEKSGKLYFHGGKIGHRVDAIKNNPKVSYCVYGQEYQQEGDWAKYVKSVVIFGKAHIVEDMDELIYVCRKLCDNFPCPPGYADMEIAESAQNTLCIAVTIENITGKLVHEL